MELLFNSCITQAEVTRKYFSQKLLFRNKSSDQGRYREAEPLFIQALELYQRLLGQEHPNTIIIRKNYAACLQAMQKTERS
jgi:hypothetical protein